MDLELSDRIVLVVGASRGIGRVAARALAEEGARVLVAGRNEVSLAAAVEDLPGAGHALVVGDVGDLDSIAEMATKVRGLTECLDGLVYAAGPDHSVFGALEALDQDAWDQAFAVGAFGFERSVRALLPELRRSRGARLVAISAQSTRRQSDTSIAYSAAKSALTSMAKNLTRSLAPDGITVNVVSPGPILTGSLRHYVASQLGTIADRVDPKDAMEVIVADHGHPNDLGRVGLPKEVARLITFLCSPTCQFLTGANINIDGGSDF